MNSHFGYKEIHFGWESEKKKIINILDFPLFIYCFKSKKRMCHATDGRLCIYIWVTEHSSTTKRKLKKIQISDLRAENKQKQKVHRKNKNMLAVITERRGASAMELIKRKCRILMSI